MSFPTFKTVRTLPSGAVETVIKGPGYSLYHLATPYREGESPLYEFAKSGGPIIEGTK